MNPFAILDGLQAAARVDNPKRDEQARKVAGSATAAISLMARIPEDKVFDADRADVLRSAASLSMQAALLESVDGSVATAYSSLAAFAVRCLDQATALQGIDADGTLREQKVLANAAAGRIAERSSLSARAWSIS